MCVYLCLSRFATQLGLQQLRSLPMIEMPSPLLGSWPYSELKNTVCSLLNFTRVVVVAYEPACCFGLLMLLSLPLLSLFQPRNHDCRVGWTELSVKRTCVSTTPRRFRDNSKHTFHRVGCLSQHGIEVDIVDWTTQACTCVVLCWSTIRLKGRGHRDISTTSSRRETTTLTTHVYQPNRVVSCCH